MVYRPENQLSEVQKSFIEWRTLPEVDRVPLTQREWCAQHGIAESTAQSWRNSPAFNTVYDKKLRERGVTTERIQRVLDVLYKKATTKDDTASAKEYLAWVRQMTQQGPPPEPEVNEMSDDDLAQALREAADRVSARANS